MALPYQTRRAGPFLADGTTKTFPFNFKLFNASELVVNVSYDEGNTEAELSTSLYSVSLNSNQDQQPGGTVTTSNPIEAGARVSIVSNVPYDQDVVFTNRGGFYPEVLNQALDHLTILTQQLKDEAARHLSIPSTSNKTPEEAIHEILDVAAQANEYARQAQDILNQTREIGNDVASNAETVTTLADSVSAMKDSVSSMKDSVSTMEESVSSIRDSVSETKELIDATAEDVANDVQLVASMKDSVSLLKDSVSSMEESVSSMRDYVSGVKDFVDATAESVVNDVELVASMKDSVSSMKDSVSLMEESVSSMKDSVSETKELVDASAENVVEIANRVDEYSDELEIISNNVDAIEVIQENHEIIRVIANDIQGLPVYELYGFDGGNITEADEPASVITSGVMRTCADNMVSIQKVAELFEGGMDLYSVIEAVDEIGSTDYVSINNTGNTGA